MRLESDNEFHKDWTIWQMCFDMAKAKRHKQCEMYKKTAMPCTIQRLTLYDQQHDIQEDVSVLVSRSKRQRLSEFTSTRSNIGTKLPVLPDDIIRCIVNFLDPVTCCKSIPCVSKSLHKFTKERNDVFKVFYGKLEQFKAITAECWVALYSFLTHSDSVPLTMARVIEKYKDTIRDPTIYDAMIFYKYRMTVGLSVNVNNPDKSFFDIAFTERIFASQFDKDEEMNCGHVFLKGDRSDIVYAQPNVCGCEKDGIYVTFEFNLQQLETMVNPMFLKYFTMDNLIRELGYRKLESEKELEAAIAK